MSDFLDAFKDLCRLHDVQTYALVGKDRDGEPIVSHRAWRLEDTAGEQRAAAALTHFELHGLANVILAEAWLPQQEDVIPDPKVVFDAEAPEPEPASRPDGPSGSAWGGDEPEEFGDDRPFVPD